VQSDHRMYVYGGAFLESERATAKDPAAFRAYLTRFPTDVLVMRLSLLRLAHHTMLREPLG
jgi:hypothetical protein